MVCSVSEMMNKVAEQNHTMFAFNFVAEDGEEVGEKRREHPWWKMWRGCGCTLSGVCVRERGVEGISLLFVHEKERRYDC